MHPFKGGGQQYRLLIIHKHGLIIFTIVNFPVVEPIAGQSFQTSMYVGQWEQERSNSKLVLLVNCRGNYTIGNSTNSPTHLM